MRRRLVTVVWLTTLWVILWRELSPANVLSGLVIAVAVSHEVTRPDRVGPEHRVRPLATVGFVAYFLWKLVEANLVLAREIVTPRNAIQTGIIAVSLPGATDFVVTVVANAVSLTPGTLTLDIRRTPDPVLYVHVLHLHDVDHARADVVRLADRAAAAFTPASQQAHGPEASAR